MPNISEPAPLDGEFLDDLEVLYSDEAVGEPRLAVREAWDQGADINKGFGGKYVWLIPHYTREESHGSTSWAIMITNIVQSGRADLAKGAGGYFRYLDRYSVREKAERIREVYLIRGKEHLEEAKTKGWISGHTDDINRDRGGDYLYLVWKNVPKVQRAGLAAEEHNKEQVEETKAVVKIDPVNAEKFGAEVAKA
ncbi:hypothetical protein CALVIDRAFT_542142 [Calocera viscosa TUFC12733]|uniref:Uncharacterized protein n=1 Tax=Calocera viscosa (strain TUFC12733) TaxID=1330018 RepID=A0A167H053_CALVF|nr:hypothetical protein CALVIDRAFT_542142 [Calocera viscosa TUFC12733]